MKVVHKWGNMTRECWWWRWMGGRYRERVSGGRVGGKRGLGTYLSECQQIIVYSLKTSHYVSESFV